MQTSIPPTPEMDRFDRALTVMAARVADLEAAARRCDNARDQGIAIEHRTEADAVRMSLIDVLEADGTDRDVSLEKAAELVAEAAANHG